MKKVMSNFLRYVLIFTTMVSGCLCAVSITGIVIDSSLGMYNNELNKVTRNGQKNLAGFYSRHIFEKMVRQNDPGCMENSNLEYVIVKGVNPNEDINSKANTKVINNNSNIVYTNLWYYQSLPEEFYYKYCKFFDKNENIKNQPASLFKSLFNDGGKTIIHDGSNIKDIYAVLSNVTVPLDKEADDLFYSQKRLIKFLYNIRYTMLIIAAVSAVIFIVLFIFCCYSRYSCRDKENIINSTFHHVPFLIYTMVMALLLALDIKTGLGLLNKSLQYATELKMLFLICVFAGIWFMSCIFLFMMFCLETSCRLGSGIFLKTTFLYFLYKILNKAVIPLKAVYNKAEKNTSLLIKTLFLLFIYNIVMLSGFILNGFGSVFFIAFAVCAALDYTVLKAVIQMEALQLHARRMAEGKFESKADTSKMTWEFKRHGDYLNRIGEGIASAVEEKIKSERFKTELITNVSHDIKTPLTSIINYTGLLKKEDIKQPEAKEYIEVLERQSARLKKLIEDLMEVSKTSTGNVTLEMELCDVNILLTQTLGEFEEKLDSRELMLIINKSPENIFIMADSRHIWRIFDNLMNNICKYGQPGTRVYINIEAADEKAVIIFRNTSNYQLNISSNELMERFVRGDASRHTEGSGLGLSIAKNLTGLMGGSMELCVDGDLFKVILEFPRAAPATEENMPVL
ncbi:MAG: HAMP domain-containing histidine kinase [Lachnospiraceae bacterium]